MKNSVLLTIILTPSILLAGCFVQQGIKGFLAEGDALDGNLVNFALPESGAVLSVSQDNPKHPGSTLNNGIRSSEDWGKGEGWELHFKGRYAYGQYFGYGRTTWAWDEEDRQRQWERMRGDTSTEEDEIDPRDYEEEDYKWRGLRGGSYYYGRRIQSAMGWVIIEFPKENLIKRVEVYTIDSEQLPASKYGVNHLLLQYWAPQAKGWQNINRYGKSKGQKFAGVRDIKRGKVSFLFKPVKTEKIRLAVLWTNDSRKYQIARGRGNRGVDGTVRLVEVEVYGTEKKKGADTVVTGGREETFSADEELDQLLSESPTEEKVSPATGQSAAIEAVVRAYEQAYQNEDITAFMATVSPDYNRAGETYQKLEVKMKNLFEKYDNVAFQLQGLKTSQNEQEATVETNYSLKLEKGDDKPSLYSGKLAFSLSNAGGNWKIVQVGAKK